ncbi:CCA tRNA nucleotidyltransferase [Actinomyces sp. zg-332]|uniref:CCA tRNA nucleotidyltransferase n=1 Tax=Actinomyces sp. zg-332 TaxID=2708340 RepID=UPI001422963D|nr:CCA tRNA nucleotidyltransferase [Actinomyces sp. zg-332]QPK94121.1 CCA tRNA nucleotidyltransferase [Actinomyces sp. zg-332]
MQDNTALYANALKVLSDLPESIMDLATKFAEEGFDLALVGGPVRDAFLGLSPHDFDFTTSALPDDTERILRTWGTTWAIGKEFGTIGAKHGDVVVEVTTYRDEKYDIESRKPLVAFGDNLEGDLSRRDFTVNSMAMRLPAMVLVDPYNGLDDLANGILRTPVGAKQSFDDDPLRIMRAARFSAQLGFEVATDVYEAMSEMKDRLEIVSAERVQAELVKLICSSHPRKGLELLVDTGVCDIVLPEFSALRETVDEHNRHKDVYEHTLTVLDKAIALETDDQGPVPKPDFKLRFSAIMHDVGKPATRKFEEDGTVSFHHHELVGAKMTYKRMRALKFDKQTIKDVTHLVALHLRFHGYSEGAWTDSAVRRYIADAGPMLERLNRLTRSDCTTRNKRKIQILSAAYDDLENRIQRLREEEELAAIRPELDGEEIMQLLQLSPGPQVGKAYKFLLNLRLDEGMLGKEAVTERLLQWWEENK